MHSAIKKSALIFNFALIAWCGLCSVETLLAAEPIDPNSLRIHIMLDRQDADDSIRRNLLRGLRAGFQDAGRDLRQVKVYYLDKPEEDARKIVIALKKNKYPQILLAWIGRNVAVPISDLLQQARIPTIVLNLPEIAFKDKDFVQSSYPDSKDLGTYLAANILQRGIRNIGVLQSLDHIDEPFNQGFLHTYTAGGGQIAKVERYRSADFDTLMNGVKSIIGGQGSIPMQMTELDKAAAVENPDASPKLAKSAVQGLLVLDDFRMIRHIAKILRYLTVEKIPLFGNYLWRSPALIEPRDSYLDGSVFVDHIGKYSEFSFHAVEDFYGSDPLLVQPEKAESYDFAYLGKLGADYALAIERAYGRLPMLDLLTKLKPASRPKLIGVQAGKLVLMDR